MQRKKKGKKRERWVEGYFLFPTASLFTDSAIHPRGVRFKNSPQGDSRWSAAAQQAAGLKVTNNFLLSNKPAFCCLCLIQHIKGQVHVPGDGWITTSLEKTHKDLWNPQMSRLKLKSEGTRTSVGVHGWGRQGLPPLKKNPKKNKNSLNALDLWMESLVWTGALFASRVAWMDGGFENGTMSWKKERKLETWEQNQRKARGKERRPGEGGGSAGSQFYLWNGWQRHKTRKWEPDPQKGGESIGGGGQWIELMNVSEVE